MKRCQGVANSCTPFKVRCAISGKVVSLDKVRCSRTARISDLVQESTGILGNNFQA